jgi:hypothetical protein
VTALSDIPIQGKMLIAAVGPRWCQHREEIIYTCTYSEMRILQLIVSGTLANAGRPERAINKQIVSQVAVILDTNILTPYIEILQSISIRFAKNFMSNKLPKVDCVCWIESNIIAFKF